MLDFTFSDSLLARLEAGEKAAVDFTVPLRAVADYMRTATVERFEDERGPDGQPWKKSQRAITDGGLTLTDRGHLRQSITAASDARQAIAGTNLIYAAIHQFGGTIRAKGAAGGGARALRTPFGPRGSVTIPARPFLGFGPVDVAEIEAMLTDHLGTALGAGQ
ncbi:MAG: phage virion morphogenesis protein [Alphaproteobacteria bacterium]|nr:phage virion morphogenesis protein [Alphaproteobacteria bacterium]